VEMKADKKIILWYQFSWQMFDLTGDQHEVTALTQSPDNQHLAVGYSDGTVRIFDLITGQTKITFSGHKSSVTALNYDQHGMRLVSGSKVRNTTAC